MPGACTCRRTRLVCVCVCARVLAAQAGTPRTLYSAQGFPQCALHSSSICGVRRGEEEGVCGRLRARAAQEETPCHLC